MGKKNKAKEVVEDETTVVGFGEHNNPELVEQLQYLLEEAKTGNVTSFTAVVLRDGVTDYETYFGQLSPLDIVSALEMLKQTIIMPFVLPQYLESMEDMEDD